ncbi:hypothetical protein P3L10_022699 [Capsicum annuum]
MDHEKINKRSLSSTDRNMKRHEKYKNLTIEEKQALSAHCKSKYQESKRRRFLENSSFQPIEMIPYTYEKGEFNFKYI